MKEEREKVKKIAEELAGHLEAGLQNEAAAMSLSREQATELKCLIDEMKFALKNPRAGKRFNFKKVQQYTRDAIELCADFTYFALAVSALVVYFGYMEMEEPTPFEPRETKAGQLLCDGFSFGLNVSCKSSFGAIDSIRSLLSGELNALQSQAIVERVQEKWRCQITVAPDPAQDIVLKGEVRDVFVKGLKFECNLPMNNGPQRKYKHCFGSVGASVGINANPLITLKTMFGSKQLSAGCLVDYDSVNGVVRRLASGGVFNMFGVSSSLMLAKLFLPQAAGQQPAQPNVRHELISTLHYQASDRTSVGGQVTHSFEAHHTAVTVGVEHKIDDSVCVKAKLTNEWHLTAMLQQALSEKTSVSVCGMVNLLSLEENPRFGLSISIAP